MNCEKERRYRVSQTGRELRSAVHDMVLGAIRVHVLHYEVIEGEEPDPREQRQR
jgi:hypothetical protein